VTKPSDFSPPEEPGVKNKNEAAGSKWTRWLLLVIGAGVVILGWLAVSLDDVGRDMFIVDTLVFAGVATYAFTAAAASRRSAVNQEKRLRLRLLVHNMELENMSVRDELTHLFNRRYLMDRLERELQTAKGFQRPLALIAIEVKSLSHINHTFGFAAGDRVLATFGRFLLQYIRATDIPGRMSGNRFGVILPDTSKRGAYVMIERLTHALAETPLMDDVEQGTEVVVSFSMSGYPWGGDTVDAIVREAEMASHSTVPHTDGDSQDPDRDQPLEVPALFRASSRPADGS
jgi:diguanylate cyclase (GGDEF)-like protein